ncbi:MAG: D-2-hydroxyacid dehydrogenase, partial [Tuberibacillus sp.]
MLVVSSSRLEKDLEDKLVKNHADTEFRFHKNIRDAIPDIPAADVLITYGEDLTDEIIYSTKELKWI